MNIYTLKPHSFAPKAPRVIFAKTPLYSSVPTSLPYHPNNGLIIAKTALQFWNRSSLHGPDQGNLACAFMVNEVLLKAIGRTYGEDPTTVNSVRTDILRSGGKSILASEAKPGDLILSYNQASLQGQGGATAHIGIVIAPNTVLANSSKTRKFNSLMNFESFASLYPITEFIRLPSVTGTPSKALTAQYKQRLYALA